MFPARVKLSPSTVCHPMLWKASLILHLSIWQCPSNINSFFLNQNTERKKEKNDIDIKNLSQFWFLWLKWSNTYIFVIRTCIAMGKYIGLFKLLTFLIFHLLVTPPSNSYPTYWSTAWMASKVLFKARGPCFHISISTDKCFTKNHWQVEFSFGFQN